MPHSPVHSPLNRPVFFTSAALILAFVVWAWLAPGQAETAIFGAMDWVSTNLGWYYILTAGIVVAFVLVVALSRIGNTKLGPDHSTPRFHVFTWAAMLFAAGIGVDLMFFGVSGPATNYLTPPDVAPLSEEAARMAPIWTMFHYGVPGWALYALMGMAFGLFAYRYHLPLSVRSALAPIFGRRIHGAVGHGVEVAATLGTVFGVATSLGIGVVFLNYGLNFLFGLPTGTSVQVALIVLSVGITIVSTVSGVDKGIRRLSELNVVLAVGLMAWVLLSGRTSHLLDALVQNVGDFLSSFPSMMLNTFAYTSGTEAYPADQWLADWTLFFWAWWIAWAPFVGLFLARISRGRTLREFILGVLIIPFGFILLWVSVFGNAALDAFGSDPGLAQRIVDAPESGFFEVLQQYPGATVTIGLAVLTGLLFYVTSADSGSLVMATMTSQAPDKADNASVSGPAEQDGPPWLRIVWAVMTGLLTLVMLFIGGVYTLQAATVLIGLPFSLVLYLLMFSLWKVLRGERYSAQARRHALAGAQHTSEPRGSWKQRLTRKMAFPTAEQTARFIEDTAQPALEAVGAELDGLGVEVHYHRGTHPEYPIPYADLVVCFPDQDDFKYQAYPVAHAVPNFAANLAVVRDVYFRVEVFSATGSRGHSIMGYTRDQVIADVLDAYEAHLNYMTLTGDAGAPTGEVHAAAPQKWEDNHD